jgi:transmembrane sensor
MTAMDEETDDTPLMRVQAEAAAWVALLHSSERNSEIEEGLKRWIAASPLHAKTWEVATDLWSETSGLPRRIPAPPPLIVNRPQSSYLRPVLAMAVVSCLVVGGVTLQHFWRARVNTGVGEQRTLNLEDGTRVELNTDSHLVVNYDKTTRTVILKSGEAYFQVARESRPFVVIAGERKVLALGTTFTVRLDNERTDDAATTVTLLEGRVAVEPIELGNLSAASTPDVSVLNPGQQLHIRKHAKPVLKSTSPEKATGWMRGQLIFDHTPLRDAVAEFNRYSELKIRVASLEAGEIPVGGIFRISDSKSFARAVADNYNLRITLHQDELILDQAVDGNSN